MILFRSATYYSAGGEPVGIAAIDINCDDKMDIINTSDNKHRIAILIRKWKRYFPTSNLL
ncbi:MAG: hypothetical protein AB8V79_05660 [Candidatus Midichloria sp.]|uniref:Uncharacterized protein n=1 Tax=Hyalomma marginatum TaxID=34627 RepID=A0A8S4BUW0_9ACAR|nr:hypothetical protein MHYMCMPASI_00003 [Hyalomma marginatum]